MKRSTKYQPTSTGAYSARADCPGCGSCANISTFTATAVDKELTCSTCTLSGLAGRGLPNPFIFRVLDKLKGLPVAGAPVTYSVISFIDTNGNASAGSNGASITRVFPATGTDFYGFNRAYLTLGPQLGTYVVEARCESCQDGQAQIAYGKAINRDIKIFAPKTTYADPDHTPVVQITQVQQPNDNKSFTTADGENHVDLQARLLPAGEDQGLITWTVEDDLSDYMDSGTPQLDTASGPASGFTLSTAAAGAVPEAPTGRPLPLRYKIHAGAAVPGKAVLSQHRMVSQDPIDKCRQEYIDWETPPPPELRNQLFHVPRSKFAIGVVGDFGRFKDCYANIYPTQAAQVAFNLRNAGYSLDINSGYRSPRYNMLTVHSSTSSPHLFGDAVDITPADRSPAGWKQLWEAPEATCPKVLEYDKTRLIIYCGSDGVMTAGSMFDATGAESFDDPRVFSIQKNCIHLGERKH